MLHQQPNVVFSHPIPPFPYVSMMKGLGIQSLMNELDSKPARE
jgi:hypothetical protein